MKSKREKLTEALDRRGYLNTDLVDEIEAIFNARDTPTYQIDSKEFKEYLVSEGFGSVHCNTVVRNGEGYSVHNVHKHWLNVLQLRGEI